MCVSKSVRWYIERRWRVIRVKDKDVFIKKKRERDSGGRKDIEESLSVCVYTLQRSHCLGLALQLRCLHPPPQPPFAKSSKPSLSFSQAYIYTLLLPPSLLRVFYIVSPAIAPRRRPPHSIVSLPPAAAANIPCTSLCVISLLSRFFLFFYFKIKNNKKTIFIGK